MNRGDIVELRPIRAKGHTQQGHRLGIILQADPLLNGSTVLVAPTSTRAQPTRWRPTVSAAGEDTLVMTDQLAAVDWNRIGKRVGALLRREVEDVDSAIQIVLGLY